MNGYELSRAWFDFCFENPEKINPNHSAIFFFAIENCNRLGWKTKFGFPTQMAMDAIGIKKHQTYIKYFNDLCEWGFFKLIQKSVNQYSANIISLGIGIPENGNALDKAIITHSAKQTKTKGQSTVQSNSSIDKPINQVTNEQINIYRSFAHLKISNEDFEKLNEEYSKEIIDEVFDKIENYKKNTQYKSLYLTAKNWLKNEKGSAEKEKEPIVAGRMTATAIKEGLEGWE